MKFFLAQLAADAACITCVVCACYMAVHDRGDWGWFLFVGLLLTGSAKFTTKP